MPTTIKLKNSVTTTNAPSSLVQGEVAINITDKKVWVGNAAGTPIQLLGAGGSASFGALTCTSLTNSGLTSGRVTYASTGGLLADSANFTFNGTTVTMANDASISGLTVGKGGGAVSSNTATGASALIANTTGSANSAFGQIALTTNTTGANNSAFGQGALAANTSGGQNAALGTDALRFNTTGSQNSAFGLQALTSNTTASDNSAFGSRALDANTTGASNTAVGTDALGANTTASNNTAVGYQAGYSNTIGTNNTAVGFQALVTNSTGSENTALGIQALYNNNASYNTAVGLSAAQSNTSGNLLAVFGRQALYSNTTGSANTAVGHTAMYANTTGGNNTAVGQEALRFNTTASNNTAVGYQAGYSNTTSQFSVYIGRQAGYNNTGGANLFVGDQAGYNNTTGTNNTFVGAGSATYAVGALMTTGSKNTIIGSFSGNQGGLDIRTSSNYIVLSDGDGNPRAFWNSTGKGETTSSTTDAESWIITNSTATRPYGADIRFTGATPNNTTQYFLICEDTTNAKLFIYSNGTVSNRTGTYNTISDAKLKENIVDATPKLDKLMQARVVNYNLIGDELKQIGFVAQELETVFPALIDNVPDLDENKQPTGEVTKGVKLTVMIPILVKAIQELKAEVDSLKAQLNK